MPESANLPPGFPTGLSIAIIVITTLVSLGPKVYKLFTDVSPRSREFKREKERLDLVKLRYEIEAFKRDKNLPDLFELAAPPSIEKHVAEISPARQPLPYLYRGLLGGLGAIVPITIRLTSQLVTGIPQLEFSSGFFLGVAVLATVGATIACVIPKRQAEPFVCFLVGLSFALLLSLLAQQSSPPTTSDLAHTPS